MMGKYNALGPAGFGVYEVEWQEGQPVYRRANGQADVTLIPGFFDIHIHGAFGIDFMSASMADLDKLCGLLADVGYEAFLPTTVTAPLKEVERAVSILPSNDMVAGFHLEGPFISEKHPGAQPAESILSISEAHCWSSILNHAALRVVTLAPETKGGSDLIKDLRARGIFVSMGHTDATFGDAEQGFLAGASHTTHTFNAMRGFHHREAGIVGYALINDDVYTELIYDRIHVSEAAARLLVKCKPPDKLVAVSDSTMATGLPAGEKITMWGHECIASKGQVRLASNGALAGSAITLKDAFQNLAEDFGLETAIQACSINPRRSIGWTKPCRTYLELSKTHEILDIRRLG